MSGITCINSKLCSHWRLILNEAFSTFLILLELSRGTHLKGVRLQMSNAIRDNIGLMISK